MGFYQQLQDELTRTQRLSKARPGKHPGNRPAAPATPATNGANRGNGATSQSYRTRALSRGRARAFATTSYRVAGIVPPVRQPTGQTCWATVTTMLYDW